MSEAFHPNAYLSKAKNIKPGLMSRTRVLNILEKTPNTAGQLTRKIQVSYTCILHHLHLLENEKIVERTTKKPPFIWQMTGIGQKRLSEFIKIASSGEL